VQAEFHLARRYLLGLRRRTHVATVSAISFGGLALGVFALIVTLSLLEGFQSSIRRDLVSRAAHARIESANARILKDPGKLASSLHEALPGVKIVEVLRGNCLVSSSTDAFPASVIGRSDILAAGVDPVLGARLGVGAGSKIDVISSRQRMTPMGPLPLRVRLMVSKIAPAEPGAEGGVLRLPLKDAQRILWGSAAVDAMELQDATDPWGLGQRIRSILRSRQDLRVKDLRELNNSLLLALSMEKILIFIAVGLMLVVAALNLLCNVAMVAAGKRRDLAVLAGMGLEPLRLRRLFLLLGLGIGGAAAFAGALAGIAVSWGLDRSGALPLPRGIFVVSSVPFRIHPSMVLTVVCVALFLAGAASWLASRPVATREPAEGLRYE